MNTHSMDVDAAETLAGVVRLLRQASVLAWAAADRAGAGSAAQLFALGVDLAADEARHLIPDGTDIEGPVPVGDEPAGLLRSAELLLRRLAPIAARDAELRGWAQGCHSTEARCSPPTSGRPQWPEDHPIALLAAMGRAVDRGLTAGHWPGRGPHTAR